MTYLLDINVLLALAWDQHPSSPSATAWLGSILPQHSFATCPITQLGFLRISCQALYASDLGGATDVLKSIVDHPRHIFWSDALGGLDLPTKMPGQLTDAYLIHLGQHNAGKLTTFDQAWKKNSAAPVLKSAT